MSIPDQSHANPVPIRFQSRANFTPIQGHSLDQSKINQIHLFANLSKSNANPLPILCQSKVNFSMNLCQSLPILANPMPISGQSVTSYVINHRTSPLYGMVPSLIGGRNSSHPVTIQCQLGSNPLQTEHRSQVNPAPIQCQSSVKMGSFQTR